MAFSATNLANNSVGTSGTSWTTDSVTPEPGALILVSFNAVTNTDTQPATPTVTGNGITYTLVNKVDFDDSSSSRRTMFVFRGLDDAPTAGAITIDWGAQTILRGTWAVDQIRGAVTTGTNGADAVVQSATGDNGAAGNSCTVTLSAFADSNNGTYGAFGETSKETATEDTGFTLLCNQIGQESTSTEFKASEDTSVVMTWINTVDAGGVALEVALDTPKITHVDSTTGGATTGTAVSVAKPTGVTTNDVVIVVVHANGPQNISDNNGSAPFTSILGNREYNGPSAQVDVFYRVIDGTEGSTFDFTLDGSNRWSIIASAYRGVDTSDPFDVAPTSTTENTGSGSTNTTDTLTTTVDGTMAIAFAVNDSNTVTFSGEPGNYFTTRENNSGEQLLSLADKYIPLATTQPAISWEQSTSNGTWLNNIFSLNPASGAPADLSISKSESITITESVGKLVTSFVNKTETVTMTEAVSVTLPDSLEISKSESVTVGEAVTLSTAFEINVSDGVTVEESSTTTLPDALAITESEAVSVGESLTTTLVSFISTLEEITTSEATGVDISMTINANEEISLAESVSGVVSDPQVGVLEEITIGEEVTVEATGQSYVSTEESVAVGESVVVSVDLNVGVVDNTIVDDEALQLMESYISTSDTATVGETVNSAQAFNLSVEDSASLSESLGFSYRQKTIIKNSKTLQVTLKTEEEKKPSFSVRKYNG